LSIGDAILYGDRKSKIHKLWSLGCADILQIPKVVVFRSVSRLGHSCETEKYGQKPLGPGNKNDSAGKGQQQFIQSPKPKPKSLFSLPEPALG
jgi:hypothetical protein